ncbi:MAG: DNA-3-methyladenine glycosylase I [Maricaulaceae bacterium]
MSYPDNAIPDLPRCGWATSNDPLYTHYHDTEWGRPVHNGKALFRKLILDGQQAGLAWITILRKREEMIRAYDNFDPDKLIHYTDADRERLLGNAGVIRSKLKINATITNAHLFVKMRDNEGIDFSDYLWNYVGGKPIQNAWEDFKDSPVDSPESIALSKDLKKRGFKFVGPVIVYAFMQAVGMINDHSTNCHAYEPCKALG